ncbi:MAG: hypothetical protein MUE34_15165 [Acidimicrobiales bacterium]|nr:hypothetical protein [Acidimicrobiales bacterium]
MDTVIFILEAIVVLGAIVMGTRSSGVGLGLWGGLGVAVLVFVFGEAPGSPPTDAVFIILAVVLTASTMEAAGGIDWMVSVAAKLIRRAPKQISVIAPLVAWLFSMGAGTANILYPLLPVIYDVSYANKVRPERPLSMAVIGVGLGVICSPVSAAMAAMITLTDVPPYNLDLADVMLIVVAGELQPPGQAESTAGELGATKEGRNSATVFLLGVAVIVLLGLFPDLRPQIGSGEEVSPLSMTTVIQLVMFTSGTLIVLICKPKVSDVPSRSVFKAGMTAAIALFGLAWLTDTFIKAHQDAIVDVIGGWVQTTLVIAALTTSQSTATRTIVPIGLASGLSAGAVVGMWPAVGGVYAMPTNGTQIAAANFDRSGTTRLGTKLFDHSFLLPMLVTVAVSVGVGLALGTVLG